MAKRGTVTIYGIKNCDTVKKARAWLDAAGVDYVFHDFRADGLERAKAEAWVKEAGLDTVLNKASTTFKALPEANRAGLTAKKAVALMLEQPAMIKRPVLEAGGRLYFGFKPDLYAGLFKAR